MAEWEKFAFISELSADAASVALHAADFALKKARLAELQYIAVVSGEEVPTELPIVGHTKDDDENKEKESDSEEERIVVQDEAALRKVSFIY